MKKSFMRGVCALNMEAMTMFNNDHVPVAAVPPTSSRYDTAQHEGRSTERNSQQPPSLNVKFNMSEKRGSKKTQHQPLVTVERHVPPSK